MDEGSNHTPGLIYGQHFNSTGNHTQYVKLRSIVHNTWGFSVRFVV